MLINQVSEENSLLRELKAGKIPLRRLLAFITEPLIFSCYLKVMLSSNRYWGLVFSECLPLRRDLITWLFGRVSVLSWWCLLSFWRCRWMGTNLAICYNSKTLK